MNVNVMLGADADAVAASVELVAEALKNNPQTPEQWQAIATVLEGCAGYVQNKLREASRKEIAKGGIIP